MKKERMFLVLFILSICLFMAACATDRTAADLVYYVNQDLLGIADLEKEALADYASVTGDNYTTDQKVYEELKNYVIPLYGRFLDELRGINIGNEKIRKVHGVYVSGAELLYDGFKTKMMGIEMDNEDVIIQGNEKIEKGRDEVNRWRTELFELYKKYGVAEVKEKK